ncbi:MAG: replication initiation protein [Gammaproteobacteria bacterium]|nr:replication initiation protein [Gammaproteobacteria bacterium]
MAEKEKSLELKKHVAAIHSSNKLSLVQRKIANALLFNAYDELLIKEEHQIHIKTLCNLIGYDSHDYKTIKKALVNLLSTVIEWNLVDGNKLDKEGVWNASSIIADASIDGPVCTYSYSNKMKKLLYTPELYGRLNMMVQAKFQSSYGLALYENCIRYQNIEQTPWFDISQFRKLMGIEEGKYTVFRDFKRRVLDKAMEEVNKYSPLHVTSKVQKQGRAVVAIQFGIKYANELTADQDRTESDLTLSQQLKDHFGFSKNQLEETLSNYEEKYILEKISIIETSPSFVKGKIVNVAKYLLSALEEDYQPAKSSKDVIRAKVEKAEAAKPEKAKKQDEVSLADYRRYQEKEIIGNFNKQSVAAKKKTLKEFEQFLGKSLYRDIYARDGLSNVLVLDQLCDFIRSTRPKLIASIKSFAEFSEKSNVISEQESLELS